MSIYRVIDKFETYVREGTWLPFGMRILSENRLYAFVDKLRSTLPEEVGRAKLIAGNKERMIREAQEKAQQIVTEASETNTRLIDQHEIVRRARTTAEIVLREAEEKATRIRAGADAYAAQVLSDLEGRLNVALGSVKKGQEALVPKRNSADLSEPVLDAAARQKRMAFDAQGEPTRQPAHVEVAAFG